MANTVKSSEWFRERAEYLSEFMLPERYATMLRVASFRTRYMTVCAENTFHPQNASALVRNCEAFGVQDLHAIECLCGFKANLNIVRGTDKWIDLYRHASTREAVGLLKSRGYRIVATTPHAEDRTPDNFDVAAGPFCLVFGTEKQGIGPEIEAAADEFLRIPMCGFVESLNVSASAAILLSVLSDKVHRDVADWRLSERERYELVYRWAQESVADSESILRKRFADDL